MEGSAFAAMRFERRRGREGDVELREHVTRRKSHLLEVGGIPGAENYSAVIRAIFELVYHFC